MATPQIDISNTSQIPPEHSEEVEARPAIGPGQGALFLNSAGDIVAAQPRCAGFFARTPEDLIDLNIRALLKPGMGQVITDALAKGRRADGISFHVLAVRKDGSEFATHLAFKFLPGSAGSCWAMFVQAPEGSHDGSHEKIMNVQVNSKSAPDREPQPIEATTETATGSAQPETEAMPSPGAAPLSEADSLTAKLDAARAECERLARVKFEAESAADKRHRLAQLEYGKRITQLDQDLVAERQTNETLSKKILSLEQSLDEQTKGTPKIKPQPSESETMLEKTMTEVQVLEQKYKALESETSGLRQERVQLQGKLENSKAIQQQALTQIAELTARLDQTSRASTDLEKERAAAKLAQQKAEELNAQVEKLRNAVEQAELRARESAAQSKDWEKKAADLKKASDELNQNRTNEQSASAQSSQRLKELELQLKDANDRLAASKTNFEKQHSVLQKLESENRTLTEANAKARIELDKERAANNTSQQETEKLTAQFKKLLHGAEQAEARARESDAQLNDWEKKAADLRKANDELNRVRVTEQSASAQSAQRLKELELQLKTANENLAASRADLEKQSSVRQRLELENRSLAEANGNARTDLDKERDTNNISRQVAKKLNAQLEKLQQAAEQAEARARESATQCAHWEKNAADQKKSLDELTQNYAVVQSSLAKSAQRIKELEQQLKGANENLTAGKTDLEKQNSTRQKLETEIRNLTEVNAKARADADKERAAGKLSQQKAEEWEKKAADFKKAIDELNKVRASEQNASAQSAQRVKELELQLKGANDNLAASRTELEKHHAARQRLESENRNLIEAGTKTKADLDKERHTNKISRQETETLTAQLQKLQQAGAQAESRARESAAQSQQRLKELEQQLKTANDHLAASKAETEKQESTRRGLEAENRKLAEANVKTKADLDMERDASKLSQQTAQQLNTELKKSQRAVEQAEARIRISTDQYCDLEGKAADLKKNNSRLEKELTERRRVIDSLNKSLAEAQQQLEHGKSERKEKDEEIARLRVIETHAKHEEYLMVDSLRRGLRQPIEDLRQSASGLLEIQLPDKQKRAAETILRHALFLQVFLNATGKNAGEKFPS